MELEEIKRALAMGHKVFWKSNTYEVTQDEVGQYLIHCLFNDSYIGLTWRDGVTMNGKEEDFFLVENNYKVIILVNGLKLGYVTYPKVCSEKWVKVAEEGVFELGGVFYDYEGDSFAIEGKAGEGYEGSGCTHDRCMNKKCQFCPCRSCGSIDYIYFPRGTEFYMEEED